MPNGSTLGLHFSLITARMSHVRPLGLTKVHTPLVRLVVDWLIV